jgi:hypothetical protein
VEQLQREEQLHLLALIAQGLGASGLAYYDTPGERVREWLEESNSPADRRARIAQIAALSGGEVG